MKHKHKYIKVGFTRSYLLNSNDGYLLIDKGYPDDYENFVVKLKKKYNLQVNDITEGIEVAVPIYTSTKERKKVFFRSFISGVSGSLGTLIWD